MLGAQIKGLSHHIKYSTFVTNKLIAYLFKLTADAGGGESIFTVFDVMDLWWIFPTNYCIR